MYWVLIFLGPVNHWAGSSEDPDSLQGDEGEKGEGENWKDERQQYSCNQHVTIVKIVTIVTSPKEDE